MKILFVITGLGMGGAEHVVVNLADELVKLGHEVKIAYLTGDVLVSPKSFDVELISISMSGARDFAHGYIKLRRFIKKFKPDVVHSHMYHSNIISRLLRLTTNIPKVISTAHSSNEGGKARMLAYRMTDRLADISTNVSEEAVKSYVLKKAVKSDRMISIPNGVDTTNFFFNAIDRKEIRKQLNIADKKMILCVGRLDEPKDYPNLFSAISMLKNSRQDFKVYIVGDGPLKNELGTMVNNLNIENYIVFLGVRCDINALMSAADIYVMSSAWEGLPMAILEAMACERFIVATDCGGIREAIGASGIVVEPKNHIQLSAKLDEALSMSVENRLKYGKLARQRIVDNYSLNANTSLYLSLYGE